MYELLRNGLLSLLKVSPAPPSPPPGAGASLRVFRASRRYLQYRLLVVYVWAGVGLIIELLAFPAAWAGDDAWVRFALAAFTVFGLSALLLAYFTTRLDYDMRYYILTDRSLRIREGVWTVQESTLTFANVQNIRAEQGPLERLFGIANVIVDTAGGGTRRSEQAGGGDTAAHRGALRGVENADEIRASIEDLLRRYRDAGLGDLEDSRRAVATGAFPPEAAGRLREILEGLRGCRAAASARDAGSCGH